MIPYYESYTRPSYRSSIVPFVGIDDFAFKKGSDYGTIICDHQTHLPIDLLPSRESDIVANWFIEHQEVVLVTRDRYTPYREAIATTAPSSIIEVLDRFHLIKNLWDLHERILTPHLPASILISSLTGTTPSANREIRAYNPKWEKILAIQQARANGEFIASIARRFNVSRPTVYHYLQLKEPVKRSRRRRLREIDEWKSRLEVLEGQRRTVNQIQRLMREEGYSGSNSSIRKEIEKIRRDHRSRNTDMRISRKIATSLLWRWGMNRPSEHRHLVDKLLHLFPCIRPIFCFVQGFREALKRKNWSDLCLLLETELARNDASTKNFVLRLLRERRALFHACERKESNGLVEGHVNRLKLIKRSMYGRASFNLLRLKVLYSVR